MRQRIHRAVALAAVIATVGCTDSFFEVSDPDVLEAQNVDPATDGTMLARSAFQNLVDGFGDHIVYSAWWSHEARVGDTFPTRNEFGRRFLDDTNGTLRDEVWAPVARAATTGAEAYEILKDKPGIGLAVAAFTEGYAMLFMAETFCDGTVATSATEPGPKLSTAQMLDLAVERLKTAQSEAAKLTGSEAAGLAGAAQVGLARAYLQAGKKAEAAAAAKLVAASFNYEFKYVDDAANRGRVGNNVWNFTTARQSLVVPPEYRAMADAGDPRIKYDDAKRFAQDSELQFYRQQKYTGYGVPIRLASGLEARYVAAEAGGNIGDQIALINERRAVGKQAAFNSSDAAAVLRELMEQKSRDFWLEGKKMGDFRRNGFAVPYVIPDGAAYYKPGVGVMGNQKCYPVPDAEKQNNPNFK